MRLSIRKVFVLVAGVTVVMGTLSAASAEVNNAPPVPPTTVVAPPVQGDVAPVVMPEKTERVYTPAETVFFQEVARQQFLKATNDLWAYLKIQALLIATHAARDCIALRHETPGSTHPYTTEHGGTPGGVSTASGRYQFLNGTWVSQQAATNAFLGIVVSNVGHAAYASPAAQDIVAAFTLVYVPYRHWPWKECHAMVNHHPSYPDIFAVLSSLQTAPIAA